MILRESDLPELARKLRPYLLPDMRAIGTSGGRNTSTGGVATMATHELASTSALGAYHTVSGLTAGQVLKATASNAASFGALNHNQLGGIGANDHHSQQHSITGSDHTLTASQYQVVGATATNTLGLLTPSADVSAGGTSLLRSNAGALAVATLTAGTKVTAPLIDSTATLTLTPGTYAVLSDGKRLRTSTYTSGFAGAGFQLDQGVTTAGQTTLEIDNLSVRGTLSVYELLIRQIRATNGAIFVSSVMKVASYNLHSGTEGTIGATYRLYPDTTLGDNVFLVGDLVRAQRFTGSGTYKSDLQITYVDPGNAYCIGQAITAKGPGAGYEYVRLGSVSDANRRGGLYLSSDDTGAPFIDIFNDVDAHSDWNTAGVIKVRVGKLDGVTGGTNEYGLWAGNGTSNSSTFIRLGSTTNRLNNLPMEWWSGGSKTIEITPAIGVRVYPATGAEEVQRSFNFGEDIGLFGSSNGLSVSVKSFATGSTSNLVSLASGGANNYAEFTAAGGRDYVSYPSERPHFLVEMKDSRRGLMPFGFIISGDTSAGSGVILDSFEVLTLDGIDWIFRRGGAEKLRVTSTGATVTGTLTADTVAAGATTITGTLTAQTINHASGPNLQYGGSTKLAIVSTGATVTGVLTTSGDMVIGSSDSSPSLTIGQAAALSTGDASIELGYGRTGSGYSYIDLIGDTTYSDYGLRIIRSNAGANAGSSITHRGTGDFNLQTTEAAAIKLRTNNTLRATVQSTGELVAEYGLYVNGDQGAISGYLGLTDVVNTTQGTGTGTIKMTSTSSRNNAGVAKFYLADGTTAWFPYWTNIS